MTGSSDHALLGGLIRGLPADLPEPEWRQVRRAFEVAARQHAGQYRKSGDPYITHPVAVAEIAIECGFGTPMVCAALLHDVVEDTPYDAARLRDEFGDEVASLVIGLTDVERGSPEPADPRILALKLLDRLQNMRTIQYIEEDKQRRKCRETLELMTPVARRLGLDGVADELEVLATDRLGVLSAGPANPGMSVRALALGSSFLPAADRDRYLEEWLGELDVLPGRWRRAGFACRVLSAMPRLAVTLRGPIWGASAGVAAGVLRWILRSELRTWALLVPFLGWMVVSTAKNGAGEAAVVLITVPPVLSAGVRWLRDRLGL
jgi:hypothetical protein